MKIYICFYKDISFSAIKENGEEFYAEFNNVKLTKTDKEKYLCFNAPRGDEDEYYNRSRVDEKIPVEGMSHVFMRNDDDTIFDEFKDWLGIKRKYDIIFVKEDGKDRINSILPYFENHTITSTIFKTVKEVKELFQKTDLISIVEEDTNHHDSGFLDQILTLDRTPLSYMYVYTLFIIDKLNQ